MRKSNKIKKERIRVDNATRILKEKKVLYFAKDQQVSSRILAVLSVGVSRDKVQVTKREEYQEKTMVYSKKDGKSYEKIITKYRRVPTNTFNKIEIYRVICGSNGKIGKRFNTCELYNNNKIKSQKIVGEPLDNATFIKLYETQCPAFKKIFASEYAEKCKTIKK